MNNNSTNSPGVKQAIAGVLLFAVPFLCLVSSWGVGACSVLFVLVGLFYFRQSRTALRAHWADVRWVLGAFVLHVAVTLLFLLLRPDMGGGSVEKPLRMLLAASAMLVVVACNPDRRLLWIGVIGGAVATTALLASHALMYNMGRPGGYVNAITAGDLLACMALLSLAASADLRGRAAGWALLGVVAGLAGMLITSTRGAAVALALGAMIYTWHMRAAWWSRIVPVICLALALGAWFVPATGVRDRTLQGMQDVTRYTRDHVVDGSSLGLRLELWRGASWLIAERPLFGASPATFQADMARNVATRGLDAGVLALPHFHNDAIQMLVSGGLAGLLAWLGTLVAPLVFFARRLERGAPALAGVFVTTSYLAFGLTEVIFWSLRASLVYAMLVFILMGLCLNAKEHDGK